ncbi:hypothetical protein SS50377_28149 [Spironucleus salmonicida]|uniref:Uncharacterized protein n=1 Tax=Spironucleus salmonicida TaxID=348837 RepID=V6LSS0_9EUKA|nr:hypothetical protein SS50377_28149 [Spironucleus salmonicida]|eukprot:EST47682.1 Hypothetical protein SS50377_12238 [Spironucleus salmonicida]
MLHQKISGKCGPIIYAGKNLFASDTMVWRVSENRIDFFVPYHGNQAKISAGGILSSVFQPFSNEIRAVRPGISSQLGDCLVCGNGKDFSLYQGTMVEHIYFTEAIDFISLFRLDGEACIIACGKDKLYIRRQSQSDLYQLPLILQGRVQQVQGVTSSVFVVLSTSEILFYEFYSNQFRVLKAIKTSQVIKSLIYHPKGALLVFLENAQCCIYVYRDGDIFVSENTLFHPFIQNNITLDTTGLFLAYLQDGGVVFAETMSRQQVALLEAVGAEQLGFTTDNRLCFGGKYGFVIVRCPDAVADVVEGFLQNSIASGLSIEEVYDRHDMWLWN